MRSLPAGTADRAYDLIAASLAARSRWTRAAAAEALEHVNGSEKVDQAIALAAKTAATEPDARVRTALRQAVESLGAKRR